MPHAPDRAVGRALTHADIREMGVMPDDIDSDWMDDMVKRLFKELRRQLAQVESTKPHDDDTKAATVRATNVRALSAIERTLERLARMEQQRVVSRKVSTVARNDEIRAELERRLDKLLTYQSTPEVPE